MKRSGPLKRTPLGRGTSQLKRTAMKAARVSGRARPGDALAVHCQAVTPSCTGRAEHRHHRAGRGKAGTALGDALDRLTLDCCRACHDYIHAHPAESYAVGWMLHRGTRVLP